MKRIVIVVALLLSAHEARAQAVPGPETDADLAISAILDTAEAANKNRQFEGTVLALKPVVEDGQFHYLYGQLSPSIRYRADRAYALAAFALRMAPEAHRAFMRASGSLLAGEETWFLRYQSAKMENDFADALVAVKTLAGNWPMSFFALSDRDVSITEQGLGTLSNGAEAQLVFEQYLDKIDWQPSDRFFSKAVIKFHQAEHLYEKGDKKGAYEIASHIDDSDVLPVMLADKRFDALTSANREKFDARAAAEKELEVTRNEVGKNPRLLEGRTILASRLMSLGREQEALDEIESMLALAAQTSVLDRRQDPDFGAQRDRALMMKAWLLFDLGQHEQALGTAAGITGCSSCGPNTDMALVIGDLLVRIGRGKEALTLLSPVANAALTFPGQAELAYLRSCAASQSGRGELAEENLTYIKRHPLYGPAYLLRALLCADDLDGAAKAAVAGLADPLERRMVLQELQHYLPPKNPTPFENQMEAKMERLRMRGDVIAAVERVGRINSYKVANLGPIY